MMPGAGSRWPGGRAYVCVCVRVRVDSRAHVSVSGCVCVWVVTRHARVGLGGFALREGQVHFHRHGEFQRLGQHPRVHVTACHVERGSGVVGGLDREGLGDGSDVVRNRWVEQVPVFVVV